MSNLIASSKMTAVIGTGISGLSAARFLRRCGQAFMLFDTRETPPNSELIAKEFPQVECQFGAWDETLLSGVDEIILSPGIAKTTPAIARAAEAGVPVVGDVELFTRCVQAPVVAITGSNGKSTVTTLVGEMAKAAGLRVAVGGNLGTPVLDLLRDDTELYVLELSSFQLETVSRLGAEVACILNLSPDHLDRYANMMAYHSAKIRVYFGARNVVVNRADPLTQPPLGSSVQQLSFGAGTADFKHFGTMEHQGHRWLSEDLTPLLPISELKMAGTHNIDNALAALAIGRLAGIATDAMLTTLRTFNGLAHRCEYLGEYAGVDFYNDSKGTNVGASLAAIKGLSRLPSKIILIMGGTAKDADFSALLPALKANARAVVLIGQDGPLLSAAFGEQIAHVSEQSMREAVSRACALAQPGDAVLLSPACASFDMFANYIERGECFRQAVEEVAGG